MKQSVVWNDRFLRVYVSTLNVDLWNRNSSDSSFCALFDAPIKDAKHYFLDCPSFVALNEVLFVSFVHFLGDNWLPQLIWESKTAVPGIDFWLRVNQFVLFCSVFYLPLIKSFFVVVDVIVVIVSLCSLIVIPLINFFKN